MRSNPNMKEDIINAFVRLFNQYGPKYTLDEIASSMHIAKKTIYKYFNNKEDIYLTILDESFAEIGQKQKAIYEDKNLSTKQKLLAIITFPTSKEKVIDMAKLAELSVYEPMIYKKLLEDYEIQWQYFMLLVEQGKKDGTLKEDANAAFLVSLLSAGMEMFYKNDFFKKTGLNYTQAIQLLGETVLTGAYK
jgi:AcrR family transcriptional regulator